MNRRESTKAKNQIIEAKKIQLLSESDCNHNGIICINRIKGEVTRQQCPIEWEKDDGWFKVEYRPGNVFSYSRILLDILH